MNLQNLYFCGTHWRLGLLTVRTKRPTYRHRNAAMRLPGWSGPRVSLFLFDTTYSIAIAALVAAGLCWSTPAAAQPREIDTAKSVMTVRVSKAGMFSALGHDHEISAPVASGTVDATARRVELHVRAASLRVRDPGSSGKDREEIQKTMLGADVLDIERYPEIAFRATSAEPAGAGGWTVHGDLTLHGQTRPITLEVTEKNGRYVGSARLRQTEFGIKPIKLAGGTVRVKDEVRVDFDVQLSH